MSAVRTVPIINLKPSRRPNNARGDTDRSHRRDDKRGDNKFSRRDERGAGKSSGRNPSRSGSSSLRDNDSEGGNYSPWKTISRPGDEPLKSMMELLVKAK